MLALVCAVSVRFLGKEGRVAQRALPKRMGCHVVTTNPGMMAMPVVTQAIDRIASASVADSAPSSVDLLLLGEAPRRSAPLVSPEGPKLVSDTPQIWIGEPATPGDAHCAAFGCAAPRPFSAARCVE